MSSGGSGSERVNTRDALKEWQRVRRKASRSTKEMVKSVYTTHANPFHTVAKVSAPIVDSLGRVTSSTDKETIILSDTTPKPHKRPLNDTPGVDAGSTSKGKRRVYESQVSNAVSYISFRP